MSEKMKVAVLVHHTWRCFPLSLPSSVLDLVFTPVALALGIFSFLTCPSSVYRCSALHEASVILSFHVFKDL